MSQVSDDELLDWIDELDDEELRQVVKYLILLNADAVQKAMNYVRRGRRRNPSAGSVTSSSRDNMGNATSSDHRRFHQQQQQQQQQHHPASRGPLGLRRSLSQCSDDITMDSIFVPMPNNTTGESDNDNDGALIRSPSASQSPQKRPPISNINEPAPMAASSLATSWKQMPRKLIVLCTSKPTSRKQGEDQDKAMLLCKQAGVAPYIMLKESKPIDSEELIQISKVLEYPQFFLKSNSEEGDQEHEDGITFLGDYDTVNQLFLQGQFGPDILKPRPQTPPSSSSAPPTESTASTQLGLLALPIEADDAPSNQRFHSVFRQSSYEESSDDSTQIQNTERQPPTPTTKIIKTTTGDQDQIIPNHFNGMNQPSQEKYDDDAGSMNGASSTRLGEIFDPPRDPLPEKPLLEAAQKAAEQQKIQDDITRGIPPHLAGLNHPSQTFDDDDGVSLGGDTRILFDPPKPPPPAKPLLEAAKRAADNTRRTAEQLRKQQDMAKGVPEHLAGLHTPTQSTDDDTVSLGGDMGTVFDPPKPRPSDKPLLDAAKRAAAQLQQSEMVQTLVPSPSEPPCRPVSPINESALSHNITPLFSQDQKRPGFSVETISLKPAVGSRIASGRMGETGRDPADDQPPPSPLAGRSSLALRSSLTKTSLPTTIMEPPIVAAPAPESAPIVNGDQQPAWMKILAEQDQAEKSGAAPAWMANIATTTTSTTTADPSAAPPTTSSTPISEIPRKPKLPEGGACYLVYDAVRGELSIYYSEIPIVGAVGVWTSSDIEAFKQAQGLGRSELIGVCASGVQDRLLYFDGWCKFVMAAKSMDATVTVLEVGVPVDFYLYVNGETQKVKSGIFETAQVDAVACLSRNANFAMDLKGKKWTKAAKKIGAVAVFRSLSSKDGHNATTASSSEARSPLDASTPTIPEEEEVEAESIPLFAPVPVPATAVGPSPADALPAPTPASLPTLLMTPLTGPAVEVTPTILQPKVELAGNAYPSATDAPNPAGGACYLVYEPDSSGRLVEHYSKIPIPEAIGRWVPAGSKKIADFKFKQNLGRSVLIGNCSAGTIGRKNYASGWCQYVRSARVMEADVMLWDPVAKGLFVDVWLYMDDTRPSQQTVRLQPGVAVNLKRTLAVACIPKSTPFYEGMAVDILKWLADGSNYGASSRF